VLMGSGSAAIQSRVVGTAIWFCIVGTSIQFHTVGRNRWWYSCQHWDCGKDCEEAVSTSHAAAGFTNNLKLLKKSTPNYNRKESIKNGAMKRHLQSLFSPATNMLAAKTCEGRTGGRVWWLIRINAVG
jgi:hypothetical protein